MTAMSAPTSVRLSELMAAMSIATDFAMGQPVEYALSTSVLAVHLGAQAGLSDAELRDVYYQALLRYVGCNAETYAIAAVLGDEIAMRTEFAQIDSGSTTQVLQLCIRHIRDANPDASALELLRAIGHGLVAMGGWEKEFFPGHCEVAQRLGERLGFAPLSCAGLASSTLAGMAGEYRPYAGRPLRRLFASSASPRTW